MRVPSARERYRPSGQVRWGRFRPWALLALAVSLAMAAVLHIAHRLGLSVIIIAPLIAAVPGLALVRYAVKAGHCRSRLLAVWLGAAAGLIMYVGHYYVGMVHDGGPQAITRVDLLPDYIAWRVRTTVVRDMGTGRREPQHTNWIWFVMELGFVVAVPLGVACHAASEPYCEACGQWMTKRRSLLPAGSGPAVAEQIDSGDLKAALGSSLAGVPPGQECTSVELEYCPTSGQRGAPCPVYLSVTQYVKKGRRKKSQLKSKALMRRVALGPEGRTAVAGECRLPGAER